MAFRFPVLDHQAIDTTKLSGVMGYQSQTLGQSNGSDE